MSNRLKLILALAAALGLAGFGAWYYFSHRPKPPKPEVKLKPKKGVRRVFKTTHKSLKFPFGTFSGFRIVGKGAELQPGVYGRKDGTSDKEMLAVQFYLSETWTSGPFKAEYVASAMALSRPKDTNLDWSFKAPETGGKKMQYFLAMTSIDEATGEGRLQLIIIGEMKKALYSITYSRFFEASKGKVRKTMEQWLEKNVEEYAPPLGLIDPEAKWIDVVRKKKK